MNYLFYDKNTLIWLMFSIYTVSALFILPNTIDSKSLATANNTEDDRAIGFASKLLMRIALIFPIIFIIKNII